MRYAFKSSAKTIFVKKHSLIARRASSKNTFHKVGPVTVPWKTMFLGVIDLDDVPPTTTWAKRSCNHDANTATIFGWNPFFFSLATKRSLRTLSNAPDTSEQYTATFRPVPKAFVHVRTKNARASRAPRPNI